MKEILRDCNKRVYKAALLIIFGCLIQIFRMYQKYINGLQSIVVKAIQLLTQVFVVIVF